MYIYIYMYTHIYMLFILRICLSQALSNPDA